MYLGCPCCRMRDGCDLDPLVCNGYVEDRPEVIRILVGSVVKDVSPRFRAVNTWIKDGKLWIRILMDGKVVEEETLNVYLPICAAKITELNKSHDLMRDGMQIAFQFEAMTP